MKLEPRGSFSFIILFLKLVWYVDNYFSFEVPAGTITAVNAKLSLSPRLEDKLTLATEEGTKLVCSTLFFLAFYKDRYKNRHGKMRRLFT